MDEQELISEAMRVMGSRTSERKKQSSAENGRKYGGNHVVTEEMREKMRAAQAARRERERQEQALAGIVAVPTEKKPVGRPRSRPAEEKPARPRGRPKKQAQEGQTE